MLYKYVGMWKRASNIEPTSNMQHSCPFPARFPRAIHQKKEKRNSKKFKENSRNWVRGIKTCNNIGKMFVVVKLYRFEVDKTSYKPQCRMVSRIVGRVVCSSCFSYLLNHLRYWFEISYVGKV